jgi:DNA-binding transcriptional ArsR family regulator
MMLALQNKNLSLARLSQLFRALGDPTRLLLLAQLAERERSGGELVRKLGLLQPAVSRHLRVLREAGLVSDRREAQRVLYSLRRSGISELIVAIETLCPLGEEGFDQHVSPPEQRAISSSLVPGSVLFVE